MSLLTSIIPENSNIYSGTYSIFVRGRPRSDLKGFQYQIWTSVKKSGK